MKLLSVSCSLCFGLLVSTQVLALPSEASIALYNQAAQGDKAQVELAISKLQQEVSEHGADALTLAYLGSAQALMGRDAWMPWNKMKYTERGLATLDKGLSLLSESQNVAEQPRRQGLPVNQLATAVAAATFTALPDLFNRFERGYDLYLSLLADDVFRKQSFQATAWIYLRAVKAALRANDDAQAQSWLAQMSSRDANHPLTAEATALVKTKSQEA